MKKSVMGLGVVVTVLALLLPLSATLTANAYASTPSYQLLKLGGHPVKWGDRTLGSGATVSYAMVDTAMHNSDARNCRDIVPMDALAERSGISDGMLQAELEAAFQVWEEAADITFTATDDPIRADILIGAQGKPVGRAFTNVDYHPDGANTVKAISKALICLNPEHRWKVGFDGNTDVYDLRYTLVHEIGHAIGLDHPSPSGQLMSFRYEETFSDLQPGDIDGVASLYGTSAVKTVNVGSFQSVINAESVGAEMSVQSTDDANRWIEMFLSPIESITGLPAVFP